MTYEYIINPETNRKCDLNSEKGMSILNNYLKQVGGSESRRKLASDLHDDIKSPCKEIKDESECKIRNDCRYTTKGCSKYERSDKHDFRHKTPQFDHLDVKDEERLSDIKSDYSSHSEDSSTHDSPRQHSPRHHSPRHHSPRQHSPKHHSPRQHSPRHRSPRHDSPRHDSPRHSPLRHQPTDHNTDPFSHITTPLTHHREGLSPHFLRSLSKPCRDIENRRACSRRVDCRVTKNGCQKYERSHLRSHKKRFTTPQFDHLDTRDKQRFSDITSSDVSSSYSTDSLGSPQTNNPRSAHHQIQQLRARDQYLLRDLEKPCHNLRGLGCDQRVDCFRDSMGYCHKLHDESRVDRISPRIQYHEDEDTRRRRRDIDSAYYGQSNFAPNLRRQIGVDPGMAPAPAASTVSSDLFV